MKKVLLFLFLFSSVLEAKNLEDLLKELEQNSYEREKNQIQQKILIEKEEYLEKGDFQEGINLGATYQENHREHQENSYLRKVEAKYGPFFASVYGSNQNEKEDVGFGLQKSLKDLWYSSNENAKRQLQFEKERQDSVEKQRIQAKKIKLIAWYEDYRNNVEEKVWKEQLLKSLEMEEKKLAKAYSLGSIRKLDLDSAQMNVESLSLELSILAKKLRTAQQVLEREFRISAKEDLESLSILDKPLEFTIESYKREKIQEQVSQIEIQKEKLRYLNFDRKMPNLSLRYEHLLKGDGRRAEDIIQVQLSKKLFEDNYEEELEKYQLEDLELDLQEALEQLESEKEELRTQYYTYQSQVQIAEKKASFSKSKYDIKHLEYELGKSPYSDVMDELDDYMESKTMAQRARNRLAAFLYEVKVRSNR